MKIGITIYFNKNASLWSNGIQLNALMLAETLSKIEGAEVCFLNTEKFTEEKLPWDTKEFPTYYAYDKYLDVDLLIFLGSGLGIKCINEFKKRKDKKFIMYKCGNEFIIDMERNIFGKDAENERLEIIYNCDEVWYVPQQHETNKHYFECLHKAKSIPVPFVYNPRWIEDTAKNRQNLVKKSMYYSTSNELKRIAIMEPNINIVKYAMYPLIIAEMYHRMHPKKIKDVSLIGGDKINKKTNFLSIVKTFDLKKDEKLFVEERKLTSVALGESADILICHQMMNPLNYIYLDAAWLGYPIIHNAEYVKDLGYYYHRNDVEVGVEKLKYVIDHFDEDEDYNDRQNKVFERFNNVSDEMVYQYDMLIKNLFNDKEDLMIDSTFEFNQNKYV
tara:strand:+ start:740 stop:1903 length:1164 start_codon:yes stop_codon:yes gene_type:complete